MKYTNEKIEGIIVNTIISNEDFKRGFISYILEDLGYTQKEIEDYTAKVIKEDK